MNIKNLLNFKNLFVKKQGIKKVMVGNKKIYERPGGCIYLTMESEE